LRGLLHADDRLTHAGARAGRAQSAARNGGLRPQRGKEGPTLGVVALSSSSLHGAAEGVAAAVALAGLALGRLLEDLLDGGAELRLGDARAHRGRRGGTARGEVHLLVHELGAAPRLVLEDGGVGALLLALNHLDVRTGATAEGLPPDAVVGRDERHGLYVVGKACETTVVFS